LLAERAKCVFDQTELKHKMVSATSLKFIEDRLDDIKTHPELTFSHKFLEMSRGE